MRILDVIRELSKIYKTYGNVDVFSHEWGNCDVEYSSIVENNNVGR